MPRISVIIPTYNTAHYLPEAIESVLRQTVNDLQIIVIDDGSSDGTRKVVEPYLERIVFLETKNNGASKARNHGIRKSSGDYVAFLDADDIWYPDKLERQLDQFSKDPSYQLVFSDARETWMNRSRSDALYFDRLRTVKPESGWVFGQLLVKNFIILSSVIVRRECLERGSLFDEQLKCWEGYDLWLRIAFKYRIGFVDLPLYVRRKRQDSTFYSSRLNEIEGLVKIMEKWEGQSASLSETDRRVVNMRLGEQYRRLGHYYLLQGRRGKAQHALRNSLARGFSTKSTAYFGLSMLWAPVAKTVLKAERRFGSMMSSMSSREGIRD